MKEHSSATPWPPTPSFQVDDGLMPQIEEHAYSELSAEVGGVLMGTLREDGTSIQGFIPALTATAEQVTLTFTHDVWEDILKISQDRFPDLDIVGWYHTHPTFGIFLSEYDLFIQQNFFNNEGHFALVIDPIQGLYGWFANTVGGDVREVASGKTQLGPRRFAEPPSIKPSTQANTGARIWGAGFLGVFLGAVAGSSVTLSQTPPDVSQTLSETREVSRGQALLISDLQGQIGTLYEDQVFTYAPKEEDTLLSIARHFYVNPASGVSTLRSANAIGSLDDLPSDSLLLVPQPTRTFLADPGEREFSWKPLSGYSLEAGPSIDDSEGEVEGSPDEPSADGGNDPDTGEEPSAGGIEDELLGSDPPASGTTDEDLPGGTSG